MREKRKSLLKSHRPALSTWSKQSNGFLRSTVMQERACPSRHLILGMPVVGMLAALRQGISLIGGEGRVILLMRSFRRRELPPAGKRSCRPVGGGLGRTLDRCCAAWQI